MEFVENFAKYIGLSDAQEVEKLLTMKIRELFGEVHQIHLNLTEAYACRDAVAKLIFKNMFTWIVEKINLSISNNL